jgi:PhnB protein
MAQMFRPEGYSMISPYLIVDGADRTAAFLAEALGGKLLRRFEEAGRVRHAEVQIDDGVVMLADAATDWPPITAHVHVYVPDVDAAFKRAVLAGAVIVQQPAQQEDEDRRCGVRDAGGTTWWLATRVGLPADKVPGR